MAWSASERLALRPAPGGLALVQDFLNTRRASDEVGGDLLDSVSSAQAWVDGAVRDWGEATDRPARRVRLTRADLTELRQLRERIAVALRLRDHLPGRPGDAASGSGGDIRAGVTLVLGADGQVDVDLGRGGAGPVVAALLLEIHDAQVRADWRRLKTCRDPECPGSFYDRSPNNSGAWHDVRTCGNIANLRAARARRRASESA